MNTRIHKLNKTYTCIYCKKTKPKNEFNSEHVIPQAFGKFGPDTFTLINKMCRQCNQNFGNTIDNALARRSLEGVHRFIHEVKDSKDFQDSKHAKNQTRITTTEPFAGEEIKLIPNSNCKGLQATLKNSPKDVAFKRKDSGKYDEYFWSEIPNRETINQKYDINSKDGILADPNAIHRLEELLGIKLSCYDSRRIPETIGCETEYKITREVFRSIAKIAFNYLAYHNESSVMLQSCFDPIRSFIADDTGEWREFVSIAKHPIIPDQNGKSADLHLVNIRMVRNEIDGSVSLHNRIHYIVHLTKQYKGVPIRTEYGHWFDPHGKKIGELGKSSILKPQPANFIFPVKSTLWTPSGARKTYKYK